MPFTVLHSYQPDPTIDWTAVDLDARATTVTGDFVDEGLNQEFRRFTFRDLMPPVVMMGTDCMALWFLLDRLFFSGADNGFAWDVKGFVLVINLVTNTVAVAADAHLHFLADPTADSTGKARQAIGVFYVFFLAVYMLANASDDINECGDRARIFGAGNVSADARAEAVAERQQYCIEVIEPFLPGILVILSPLLHLFPQHGVPLAVLTVICSYAGYALAPGEESAQYTLSPGTLAANIVFGAAILVATIVVNVRIHELHRQQFLAAARAERAMRTATAELEEVDTILRATLPESVLDRLSANEPVFDVSHSATVLFSDLAGFTAWSSVREAEDVVTMLNTLVSAFDGLASASPAIEKVKTIGDAYWAVAGMPVPVPLHASAMCRFGLLMQSAAQDAAESSDAWSGIKMRIGIHTGAANASVLGTQRLSYEPFGEACTFAEEAEKACEPTRVCITAATRAQLVDEAERDDIDEAGEDSTPLFISSTEAEAHVIPHKDASGDLPAFFLLNVRTRALQYGEMGAMLMRNASHGRMRLPSMHVLRRIASHSRSTNVASDSVDYSRSGNVGSNGAGGDGPLLSPSSSSLPPVLSLQVVTSEERVGSHQAADGDLEAPRESPRAMAMSSAISIGSMVSSRTGGVTTVRDARQAAARAEEQRAKLEARMAFVVRRAKKQAERARGRGRQRRVQGRDTESSVGWSISAIRDTENGPFARASANPLITGFANPEAEAMFQTYARATSYAWRRDSRAAMALIIATVLGIQLALGGVGVPGIVLVAVALVVSLVNAVLLALRRYESVDTALAYAANVLLLAGIWLSDGNLVGNDTTYFFAVTILTTGLNILTLSPGLRQVISTGLALIAFSKIVIAGVGAQLTHGSQVLAGITLLPATLLIDHFARAAFVELITAQALAKQELEAKDAQQALLESVVPRHVIPELRTWLRLDFDPARSIVRTIDCAAVCFIKLLAWDPEDDDASGAFDDTMGGDDAWMLNAHRRADQLVERCQHAEKVKTVGPILLLGGPLSAQSDQGFAGASRREGEPAGDGEDGTPSSPTLRQETEQFVPPPPLDASALRKSQQPAVPGALGDILFVVKELAAAGVSMRVGIHVGPVVGAVLGTERLCFDIFGDTVNTTSRIMANIPMDAADSSEIHVSNTAVDDDAEVRSVGSRESIVSAKAASSVSLCTSRCRVGVSPAAAAILLGATPDPTKAASDTSTIEAEVTLPNTLGPSSPQSPWAAAHSPTVRTGPEYEALTAREDTSATVSVQQSSAASPIGSCADLTARESFPCVTDAAVLHLRHRPIGVRAKGKGDLPVHLADRIEVAL